MIDNQIIKKRIVTNYWYRCLMAGYRLNGIAIKHIEVIVL